MITPNIYFGTNIFNKKKNTKNTCECNENSKQFDGFYFAFTGYITMKNVEKIVLHLFFKKKY